MKVTSIQSHSVYGGSEEGCGHFVERRDWQTSDMGKDDEKGCKLFVFHRKVLSFKQYKHYIFSSLQGGFSLQCRYPGSVKTDLKMSYILFPMTTLGEELPIKSDFQAKFSEFGRLIDVHDTGNGFAFVTYNHKKVNL